MKKTLTILSIILLSTISNFAQVDSTYRATLQKMFKAAGSEEIYKSSIKQIISFYKQQYQDTDTTIFVNLEQEFLKTSLDELIEMLLPVYQKYLTEEDLNGMIEFYKSPVGKKFAKSIPMITQESMQIGQQWGMKIGQEIMKKLNEKEK